MVSEQVTELQIRLIRLGLRFGVELQLEIVALELERRGKGRDRPRAVRRLVTTVKL